MSQTLIIKLYELSEYLLTFQELIDLYGPAALYCLMYG
nr:MAG TPA: SAPK-associated protein-1 [Bacteriophage sp.]